MVIRLLLAGLGLLFASGAAADTCVYQPGNNNDSGDSFYIGSICEQRFIDQFWDHFDFDKGDWDDGFGFWDPCNVNKRLQWERPALGLSLFGDQD
jgi:hypothetical protein